MSERGDGVFCKKCSSADVESVPVSCPEGREGCLVMHWGFRCRRCGHMGIPVPSE